MYCNVHVNNNDFATRQYKQNLDFNMDLVAFVVQFGVSHAVICRSYFLTKFCTSWVKTKFLHYYFSLVSAGLQLVHTYQLYVLCV